MAIVCPQCETVYDVALFHFGRWIRCDCGERVDLDRGHRLNHDAGGKEGATMAEKEISKVTHYFGNFGVAAK